MTSSLVDRLSYKCKKFFRIDPLMEKEKEFKEELDYFLEKSGKSLEKHTPEEIEFLMKLGSAIYSGDSFGFTEDYLINQFWEDWGQYMNDGKGYTMPDSPLELVKNLKDTGVLKIRKCTDFKAVLLSDEYKKMRECKFWKKDYKP